MFHSIIIKFAILLPVSRTLRCNGHFSQFLVIQCQRVQFLQYFTNFLVNNLTNKVRQKIYVTIFCILSEMLLAFMCSDKGKYSNLCIL